MGTRHIGRLQPLLLLITAQVLAAHLSSNGLPGAAAAANPAAPAEQSAAFIIRFRKQAVLQVKEQLAATAATASAGPRPADAAAVAAAAAADRGESIQGQQRVANMAAAAADAAPAIAAITASISAQAAALGVQLSGQVPIKTVFEGTVLNMKGVKDVTALKKQLEANPQVEKVWISRPRSLVQPVEEDSSNPPKQPAAAAAAAGSQPQTATTGSVRATGLQRLSQKHPGLDGNGSLICVIDTGINYRLHAFGSCERIGYPKGSCRVAVGHDFVGDFYNGQSGSIPVEDDDPLDCYPRLGYTHGTMTASTAATVNGVAPGALLGAYRVFGCSGLATDAVIVPAIDRAVADGCHIINLSLSAGSGYEERSPYNDVMQAAFEAGVVAVKAAGNSGATGNFFESDVAMAAGSIATGSVGGYGRGVDDLMTVSSFSAFGPHPELKLGPHVCAPGADITVLDSDGSYTSRSGTSFSCPYTAGLLALWRQYRQQQGDAAGKPLDFGTVNQDAAMRGLVSTAAGVREAGETFLVPVARCGTGIIQADAFLENQLHADPLIIQPPSALRSPYNTNITLKWEGPSFFNGSSSKVTYDVIHEPAFAIPLSNGWYGTGYSTVKRALAADVVLQPSAVTVNTAKGRKATVQVSISLPQDLKAEALLYSGLIRFVPRPVKPPNNSSSNSSSSNSSNSSSSSKPSGPDSLAPVVVPYQGYSWAYSSLPIMARPVPGFSLSNEIRALSQVLCYAPNSAPYGSGSIMDSYNAVPGVCSGGFAQQPRSTLRVSLAVLNGSPQCSLRITLAPEVPMAWLYVDVINATNNQVSGSLDPIDTSAGSCLVSSADIWSWCLNFNGSYKDQEGNLQSLQTGKKYKLGAWAEGPVCAGDAKRGRAPRREKVNIRGRFQVVP